MTQGVFIFVVVCVFLPLDAVRLGLGFTEPVTNTEPS